VDPCPHCLTREGWHNPECPNYREVSGDATLHTPADVVRFNVRLWDWCLLFYTMPLTWDAFLLTAHTIYHDTYQPWGSDTEGHLPIPWRR
jgi:hypothetical protein